MTLAQSQRWHFSLVSEKQTDNALNKSNVHKKEHIENISSKFSHTIPFTSYMVQNISIFLYLLFDPFQTVNFPTLK